MWEGTSLDGGCLPTYFIGNFVQKLLVVYFFQGQTPGGGGFTGFSSVLGR